MTKRRYGQFCGIARALELVGERWALLIVRDLLLGPKRYTDLREGMPRIPTNVLASRLKELEAASVVQRRLLPRPESSVVYELTPHGRELEDILLRLGRWGATSLEQEAEEGRVYVDPSIHAFLKAFQPEAARGVSARAEVHFGNFLVHVCVNNDTVVACRGGIDEPDLIIEAQGSYTLLMTGEVSPEEAISSGRVRVHGDVELFARFVECFRIPSGSARAG
jgi:DNA-binding HxlR family transcriptional regulator